MNAHFFLIALYFLLPESKVADQIVENLQQCTILEQKLNTFIWSETQITDNASTFAYKAIELNCPCIMQAYNVLGFLSYNKSNYNEAEKLLHKAEDLFYDGKGTTAYLALNQNYLALLEIIKKDPESALYHLEKSRDLATTIGDSILISFANLNIGLVLFDLGEIDLAEQALLKSLEVKNIQNKIRENDGYAYLNLSRVYLRKGDLNKALEYIEKSKKVWLNLDHKKGLYLLALCEATVLTKRNNFKQALVELQKGRAYGDSAGVSLLKGEYYIFESKTYQSLNDEANEIVSLTEALNYSVELSLESIENILDRLTELLKNEEKTNVNQLFLTAFKRLKDQNKINTKKKLSNEKNLGVEIEKKEQGESTIKRQNTFIFILVLFSGILVLLIIGIIRQHALTKKLNQKLLDSHNTVQKQINQLKLRNNELQNFAYEASHDLKSPLRTIESFAQLLEKKIDEPDKASRKYIHYIQNSANSMTKMITSLLNHSTSQNGTTRTNVHIVNIIEQAIQNVQTDITNAQAKVIYKKNNKTCCYCDKTKFIQLLQNLISNAINYAKQTEKPIIQIRTETSPTQLTIKVQDNGIGIDEKHHQIIFEMFKRLKTKPTAEGTGIGLATCKKIVELHKGKISVQSKLNQGTQFTITIPHSPKAETNKPQKAKSTTGQLAYT